MSEKYNLAAIRKEYTLQDLTLEQTAPEPFTQFQQWLAEALEAKVPEPNAMHLATVSANGRPSGRIVLLKGLTEKGFVFFTNYQSRKGQELASNQWASLTFFWPELERQVRIEGSTELISAQQSDAYFHSRPRGSQIGAWASPQSQQIPGRQVLEENTTRLKEEFGQEQLIPRPPHWGGYCIVPDSIEFWQGRPSRLHDRIVYTKTAENTWQKHRLAP
ncbi:pyridoxamine 5'-phosphate oxidase [Rhodocytophaga aerolata]|uniref:Pyridoxine/pyridoxamine 5'-phosphate oxidase n=1 Tax=Rhodocytophaga aerolata TaxID=455078 RepID=A0ABT8QXX3_9BACT|nr:pyridoxamine 5'-phosphate oxidase [Rhodocytophaga aerolata]MDO1444689.1 pyridoxamine 5'-phosphate oxidase [Rhodocytophaga aerolata]